MNILRPYTVVLISLLASVASAQEDISKLEGKT